MTQRHLLLASCACLAACVAFAAPASAQDSAGPDDPILGDTESDASVEAEEGSPIVVTGSRIPRRDFTSPSPIVTVTGDQLQQSGAVTLDGALNKLPQLMGGTNATSLVNRTGRASLNLRGLGEARSLVLLDGRRIQPATATGAVDINVIPAVMVQSVETITGGASAVYGSDAMSGVVNFKLLTSYNGLMIDGQTSISSEGDAGAREISILAGSTFSDGRGDAMLALSYADRDPLSRASREFTEISTTTGRLGFPVLNVSANPPTQAAVNAVFAQYGVAPGTVNRTTTLGVNNDGSLFTPSPGTGRPIVNYKGPLEIPYLISNNSILLSSGWYYGITNELERFSGLARVTYEITDHITATTQLLHTQYDTVSRASASGFGLAGTTTTVSPSNQFIPADLRTILNSRTNATQAVTVTMSTDFLGPLNTYVDWDVSQGLVGFEGDLGIGDLTWNIYGTLGRTQQALRYENAYSLAAAQTLLSRADGGTGICAGGLNIFGPQANISPTCIAYIRATPNNTFVYDQAATEATMQGSLFELPGGPVKFSLGAGYRWDSYDTNFDDRAARGDIPGVIGGSSEGSRSVAEVFGELLIPILSGLPLVHSLELNLGYRYSDYSIGEGAQSYTANVDWALTDFFRLRGGYSRAIRAPSLEDLYASASQVTLALGTPSPTNTSGDPCDVRTSFRQGPNGANIRGLCLAMGVPAPVIDTFNFTQVTLFGTSTGNVDLDHEKANTYSIGAVIDSPFDEPAFSDFRASIDFFNIEIEGAIGQMPLSSALARCFNLDGVSNTSYSAQNINCTFFPRNPNTGFIEAATVPLLNLGLFRTAGVDFQVDWRFPLSDYVWSELGTFELGVVGTYLDKFRIQTLPDTAILDYAGSSQSPIDPNGRAAVVPEWKWIATATLDQGPVRASVSWRHIAAVFDVSLLANPNSLTPGAPSKDYFDLSLRVDLPEELEFRLGANNIFNEKPPVLAGTLGNTDFTTYDVYGPYFTAGFRKAF